MPKRIPHLDEAIIAQASHLFSRLGYDAVDMKQVAAEAGTSVGNLYNYCPSKPALFLAVVTRWKKELLDTCRAILAGESSRREKILGVLRRLYDDLLVWHGLWSEFLGGREERHHVMAIKSGHHKGPLWGLEGKDLEFLTEFETLLTGQVPPGDTHRWALLVVSATIQMAGRYPQYREDNWKFIETLVDKI